MDALACPACKATMTRKVSQQTASGVIKQGSLYCEQCEKDVATIRHGKVDFLRIEPLTPPAGASLCGEFHYKRIPWSDEAVSALHCHEVDVGWNAEGFTGCLQAGSTPDWRIYIDTEAVDLSLRFLSHDWSGCVAVTVNDGAATIIDLHSAGANGVNAYEIYRDLQGQKKITIKPAAANPLSRGEQIYFFGMDAVFSGWPAAIGGNRGNGFPAAYQWVLDHSGPDALVLDCGSGDRKYPDQRVVSFEYMPFELPDVFGDGHALPFSDGVFDAVFSQAVMEHMRNPYLAAREIARVLKPGGLVYVESAFMQPLHAVPYHFFNTTTWGIEAIFGDADVTGETSEWFGPISASVDWYLNACGGGGLSPAEREQLRQLFLKIDENVSYEQLKPIASAVSFWGIKAGASSVWKELLATGGKPSFKYTLAQTSVQAPPPVINTNSGLPDKSGAYRRLRSAIRKIRGKVHA
ncbi:class I SAM-dependent methyltransferase [Silvimonas iriomotensis]|nr:class I SAM-dependent methyltransferase [Silvimonas iriomotensis]